MKSLVILLLVGLVILGVESEPQNFGNSRNSGSGRRFNNNVDRNRFGSGNRFNSQSSSGSRFNDFSHGYDDLYGGSGRGSGSSNFGQGFSGSRGSSNFGNTRGSMMNRPSYQGRTRGSDMLGSYSNMRNFGTQAYGGMPNYGTQAYGGIPAWMWMRLADDSLELFDDRRKRNAPVVSSDNTAAEVL